jgi:FixJ family two-component response regulator
MQTAAAVAQKNSTGLGSAMTDEDRTSATALLDEAMETFDTGFATRCRVVAALLHGHENRKIIRNLGVTEKAIESWKAAYDKKGLAGLK